MAGHAPGVPYMEIQPGQRVSIGRWHVDSSADEIEADGQVVKLEPQQMRLLLVLARRAGQVVLTQELLDEVWRDLVVTPNSVYQAVAQLRRQLGDMAAEPAYIQTVHRKGYRLLAPVRVHEAGPPAPLTAAALPPDAPPSSSPPASAASPAAPAPGLPATRPGRPRRWWLAGMGMGVAAAAAAGFAGLAAWRQRLPAASGSLPRLAVLPFRDRQPGGTEQALAQGLALDVIRALGRRSDLTVLAADSAIELGSADDTQVAEQARRLNVRYLLLGNLQRQGSLLQLDLRLMDNTPPGERWQRRFERSPAVLSQLPAAIAAEVTAALGLPAWAGQAPQPGPSEAYELYVLGENAWRPRTPDAFEKARAYFQRGIELDPGYARNYVGLAWAWLGQATNGAGLGLPQAIARATPLFERAQQLDPDAADTLTGQAVLHGYAGEHDQARALLARAIAVQPNYAQAHLTLGITEFDDGWPLKAQRHFEQAVALNPLAAAPLERLALSRLLAGQPEAAARDLRRVMVLQPRHPNASWGLGMVGYANGDLVHAVDGYRQALALEKRRPYLWHELAWLYLDLQRADEAARAFAQALDLLPGADWLPVHASYAWLAQPERAAAPAALALNPQASDRGDLFADLCFVRAMAGLPLDAALLQRSLDVAAARSLQPLPNTWFVFQGWYRTLNLATVQTVLGQTDAAAATLTRVERHLDALVAQGNRWPMLDLHRARVLALRGRGAEALAALERAAAAGSRRAWWLRLDPALAALQAEPRLQRLLARLDEQLSQQRNQLGL